MTTIPNYLFKVQSATEKAIKQGIIRKGQLCHVYVSHDQWCNQLAGRGPCNCNPDVQVRPEGPEKLN